MSQPLPNPPPELLDELTAYLDGELDAAGSRRVEELLARDPRVREELQRLERAWQLLEELPGPGVDETFTRSTVAMVAMAAEEQVAGWTAALPAVRRRRWSVTIAGLCCAAAVGFAGVRFLAPNSNEQLLQDLQVIEHLDEYRQAGDIEFLRLLADEKLFVEESAE